MSRAVPAVYEKGVLRPLQPLSLEENQQVVITVREVPDDVLDYEFLEEINALQIVDVSLEDVRKRLSKINGSLSEEIIADREGRF